MGPLRLPVPSRVPHASGRGALEDFNPIGRERGQPPESGTETPLETRLTAARDAKKARPEKADLRKPAGYVPLRETDDIPGIPRELTTQLS